jgi:hypothetical protein
MCLKSSTLTSLKEDLRRAQPSKEASKPKVVILPEPQKVFQVKHF